MKCLMFAVLLTLGLASYSQKTIGFTFGGYGFIDRDEVLYIDNPVNFGGEAGINVSLPFLSEKLAFETGLLFYDFYYRIRGPYYQVWFTDTHGSSFYVNENFNDFGLNLPITIGWNKGRIRPFLCAHIQQSFSSNRIGYGHLGGITVEKPVFFNAKGIDVIELSAFTWYLNAGVYVVCSPKVKLKFQYAMGMNDFVTHNISPQIINDVNLGTTVQSSRINKFQVALVYTPSWNRKEQKKQKENKPMRPLYDKMKDFYK